MPCKNCQKKREARLPIPAEMTKVTGVTNMTHDFANDSDFLLVQYIYPNSAAVITSNDPNFYEKYGIRNYGRQAKGFRFYMLKSDFNTTKHRDRLALIEVNAIPEPVVGSDLEIANEPEPAETTEETVVEEKPKTKRQRKSKETSDETTEEPEENTED